MSIQHGVIGKYKASCKMDAETLLNLTWLHSLIGSCFVHHELKVNDLLL